MTQNQSDLRSDFDAPKEIPEEVWCRNGLCCCRQTNYDNHPEGKAAPTRIYHLPKDDNESWVSKHAHFHFCWALGIEEPFYCGATELELQARAINILRMLHNENFELRKQLEEKK